MNEDVIKGQWKQLKGRIKAKWGQLTDDDLDVAEGNSEYLAGRIQERYGRAKDDVEKEIHAFRNDIDRQY
ncbi:CsbD family protein [Luteibacter sp. PPL201]|uniref:CsbD family protein n=1 Tax=Luteibacter sahnii TaxID=3021977 RepID=A0ABT6BDG9_9GAMM|nr:CsbD family protein [Luteibacter sp. PPL193]MDY1548976.1 CsbD family protein [Luteibacter sp. PPL193]